MCIVILTISTKVIVKIFDEEQLLVGKFMVKKLMFVHIDDQRGQMAYLRGK